MENFQVEFDEIPRAEPDRGPCTTCPAAAYKTKDGKRCAMCCYVCTTLQELLLEYNGLQLYRKALAKHQKENHIIIKKTHAGNGTPVGPWAFTLTKSPSDDLTEEDMVKAVRKLMAQKSCPVEKYAWYLEYGKPETKEHPHIHGMYQTPTGGRIETKFFKRLWNIWNPNIPLGNGFRGGYHRPVKQDEAYADYIKKSGGLGDFN